jgi:hypothetical protein
MRHKIKSTHKVASDGDLANIAYRIVESLKDNQHFPNPTPALAVVETALQEYRDALVNAAGKDKAMVSVKNDKRAVLRALLAELANYVTDTSQGDKSLLLTSGFDLARQRGERVLPPIERLTVEIGPPGEAITRVKKITGAKAYVHQYTTEPDKGESGWVSYTSTDRQYRFVKLESAVRHWFRVIAIGVGGQQVVSGTESCIIQ